MVSATHNTNYAKLQRGTCMLNPDYVCESQLIVFYNCEV